ncbi:MAG: hypothetical protein GX600_05510 [Dehalococcoidia bacterium]|nr:hypothetical protein [Dehalococcoidia bacterium]
MNSVYRRCDARYRVVVLALALCAAVTPAEVGAEDVMRCSLGTVQTEPHLFVSAGSHSTTTLLFYSIDGNVPAELEFAVLEAPSGWEIILEHAGVDSSCAATVSLVVTPSLPSLTPHASLESGRETVWIEPRGYVCAEKVRVHIQAPATAASGAEYAVKIGVEAVWNVPGLGVPLLQEREFVYWVCLNGENATATQVMDEAGTRVRVPLLLAGAFCLLCAACLRGRIVESGRLA